MKTTRTILRRWNRLNREGAVASVRVASDTNRPGGAVHAFDLSGTNAPVARPKEARVLEPA